MIKGILTDIEGTTSSIRFVHEVLFPYAARHLPDFIRDSARDAAVRRALDQVAADTGLPAADTGALTDQLLKWIRADVKAPPLKALQGMVWEKGYADGDFQGHIYEDAVQHLRRWREAGIDLYVYSSGSVRAQKLLFAHTAWGDLTPLFTGYFDTGTGPKKEASSYRRILEETGLKGTEMLFLSDIAEELAAARAAGMHTCRLDRDSPASGAPAVSEDWPVVGDFSAIRLPRSGPA